MLMIKICILKRLYWNGIDIFFLKVDIKMIYRIILCCACIIGSSLLKAQNEDLINKEYNYQTLSPYLKKLVDTFLLDQMPIGKSGSMAKRSMASCRQIFRTNS